MRPRATMDLASLRKLREQREALRGVELFSYSEDLRSVMVSPVLTCGPDEPVRAAVARMAAQGITSVVVVDEHQAPLGIVTDHDVLRLVAGGRLEVSVAEVMTADPLTLSPDDTVYRALFLLSSRGIKHLPLVDGGRLAGIVTLRQLLKLRYPEPMTLIAGIAGARDVEALARIKARLPRLAASRLGRGSRAYDVVVMLSLINQDLHRRAFELACERAGEPPAACCLYVTGSHGRLENLLVTDQDHGLILADGENERDRTRAEEYYAGVAETFAGWLEEIGFPRCEGDVMATNPIYRLPLAAWKAQFDGWITHQVKHLGRYMTLFFDARPVHGDEALFRELSGHAFDLLGRHHEVLRILHEEESGHRVPTGLLGRFITERSGKHRGQFDIKRSGLIFVVEGVRILALSYGVRETETLKRITRLVDGGHLHADDGEYFEGAYRFLLHFALDAQVEKAMKDEEIDTYVNPNLLSHRNRNMLRHAYKAVSSLQDLIATEFGEVAI